MRYAGVIYLPSFLKKLGRSAVVERLIHSRRALSV
jgi:hypothetical protein